MSLLVRLTWLCPHCEGLHRTTRGPVEACSIAARLLADEGVKVLTLEDAATAIEHDLDDAEEAADAVRGPRWRSFLSAVLGGLLRQRRP